MVSRSARMPLPSNSRKVVSPVGTSAGRVPRSPTSTAGTAPRLGGNGTPNHGFEAGSELRLRVCAPGFAGANKASSKNTLAADVDWSQVAVNWRRLALMGVMSSRDQCRFWNCATGFSYTNSYSIDDLLGAARLWLTTSPRVADRVFHGEIRVRNCALSSKRQPPSSTAA